APATIRVVHEAEEGGPVFVEQTADGQHGDLDGVGCLAHRGVFPVVVTPLVAEPVLDVHRGFVDAPLPVFLPAVTHDRGVLGASVVSPHRRGPGQHLVSDDGSAVVVDVVGVAVVGGADGDDGGEFRWLQCGKLQTVESAPRLADDTDFAVAPVLRRDPLKYLQSVVEFCRRVLIGHDTGRITTAAQIDTDAGVTGAGELGVDRVIATGGHVVLAVGNVLKNSGNSIITEIFGQPDSSREFDPIT